MRAEPGNTPSESSDDSFGDVASQDTSGATTTTTTATTTRPTNTTTSTRISPDNARVGRDVENRRHVTAMTSSDNDDEDEDNVFISNHGNRAAAAVAAAGVHGWTDLYRQSMRHGLTPMSTCSAAVTIGQS